ncbi:hypothetical protein SAMN05421803_107158 [Nocardiopsis flavescens]|uniref:DUF2637 domain-containing protein n=1 Tax=Nocardiopsis flavescens TaxID=758803 RepID=A0A1M6KFX3_9ACTN|nr:DUF2637 domain-containing protein [Nocardiopsis flavescens]SHJ57824.1 hypothetical protein SAMN05421803_107158 [Nocardiopsis flavescens]
MSPNEIEPRPERPAAVRAVAIAGLALIVGAGLFTSFANLHAFAEQYGKAGAHAVVTAATVDALTLLGLLVALTYPSFWARLAFVIGLFATGAANGTVGWAVASWPGVATALFPVLALELSYKVVLGLLLPTRPGGVVTTPAESDQAGARQVVTAPDHPELPMVAPGPGPDPSMAKAERLDQVRALLDDQPDLTAQQVADHLGVSLTTGRRYSRQVRAERVAPAPA